MHVIAKIAVVSTGALFGPLLLAGAAAASTALPQPHDVVSVMETHIVGVEVVTDGCVSDYLDAVGSSSHPPFYTVDRQTLTVTVNGGAAVTYATGEAGLAGNAVTCAV